MTIEDDTALPYLCDADGTCRPLDGVESIFLRGSTIEICGLQHLIDENEIECGIVSKETLLGDIQFRGAISDFHPVKAKIVDADYDPLLLKHNADDIYGDGNNFELAWKKVAADQWLAIVESIKERKAQEERQTAQREEEASLPRFKRTRVIRPWISLGSEKEVETEQLDNKERPLLTVRRKIREFKRPVELNDTSADDLWNAEEMECPPFKGNSTMLSRRQRSYGIQATKCHEDRASQATEDRLVNDCTQTVPRDLPESEKDRLFYSPAMTIFLQNCFHKLEDIFFENEIVDVLGDDFEVVDDEGSWLEQRETVMKEHQSFADLTYSKGKLITCLQWSPLEQAKSHSASVREISLQGVIAVSYMDPTGFESRSQRCGKPQEYAILEWTTSSPMTPQKILLSPYEITAFEYNPCDSNLLAAGSFTGQIVMWELNSDGNRKSATSILRCSHTCAIDACSGAPVEDLKWIPGWEMSKTGTMTSTEVDVCYTFVTCSIDGRLMFWDIRLERVLKKGQHLDQGSKLNFKPIYIVPLFGHDSQDIAPQKLCFAVDYPKQLRIGSMNGDIVIADLQKIEGKNHVQPDDDEFTARV